MRSREDGTQVSNLGHFVACDVGTVLHLDEYGYHRNHRDYSKRRKRTLIVRLGYGYSVIVWLPIGSRIDRIAGEEGRDKITHHLSRPVVVPVLVRRRHGHRLPTWNIRVQEIRVFLFVRTSTAVSTVPGIDSD
ncbi:hypothetical protein PISMIDRAFT_577585 [Pisolithus microcarpus 441]|uniref:Uncharacterized protein n=1 Tax=Pisolithus microcarpus 441 TaxID=765257 RepID=A0A0C9YRS2_9AGAM|nr:hypothetical protein BKA83DRAFT_577585 [Pisolithus microcarpus]KIK10728.1 hypothetical protein PISMIDRAFT_577585 [Pisolithus microcarpus 441]